MRHYQRWFSCILIAFCLSIGPLSLVDRNAIAQSQTPEPLTLLQSDASRVVLELAVDAYDAREQTINGATFATVVAKGLAHSSEPGKPQLPLKGALIGIPAGAAVSLQILADESRSDSLTYPPLPSPTAQVQYDPALPLPRYVGKAFTPDTATYAADQLYPAEAVRLVSVGNWRSQRYARLEFAPLQYNPVTHQLIFHRRLRVAIVFQYAGGLTPESLGSPIDEGSFEQVFAQSILNYTSAKSWRTHKNAMQPSAMQSSAPSIAGPMVKIAVNGDGIYQITCAQLANVGINLATLDSSTLKIYKQGTELALSVTGSDWSSCDSANHYLEFFAQAARTKYTDTNIYWLTYGGAPGSGKRMSQRNGSGAGTLSPTFTNSLHIEKNWLYISYAPYVEDSDHWYSYNLPNAFDPDGNGDPNSANYGFQADTLASGAYTATLTISLRGLSPGSHHTLTSINNNLVDDATWNGSVERTVTRTFPQSYLSAITNTIRVSEALPFPNTVYINYFDVSYASQYRAKNDLLRFRQSSSGAWQYQISNFTSSAIETFDISDPFNVARIVGTTIVQAPQYDVYLPLIQSSSTASTSSAPSVNDANKPNSFIYSLQFADTITTTHEYIALTAAQRKTPLSIALDTASNLRDSSNSADYIFITYGGFIPNVQPLAAFRQAQGQRVKVADVQDVYDEFSDGLMDAQAIHDFLQYAYTNWQAPKPQFVLLVGNGNFDFKNYNGTGEPNFIPPYLRLVDPWIGETASDNRLVAFGLPGSPLPYLSIGRLPALSAAHVDAMVTKIINYEQNPPAGAWRTTVTFVADNAFDTNGFADPAGNFWALSDAVINTTLPVTYTADRIYFNPCNAAFYPQCVLPYTTYPSAPSARSATIAAINDGRLIVNYIGHSRIQTWAGESLFDVADLSLLANGGKLPVILAMTCYDGYFHFPAVPSIAAANVRLANGGALASWSASGLGVATGHDYLNRGFMNSIMQPGLHQLGPATIAGKLNLWTNGGGNYDLIDTFNLLGDPASRLAVP